MLYTDGLLDERQARPELRLLSIVSEGRGLNAVELADRIETTATRADVVYDDRAVLVVRLLKQKAS